MKIVKNPYWIDGPASIGFSGGRTSGFMLWNMLQAHGGELPDDVHVLFANTGKEREETLAFVQACSNTWGVPITWLEYVFNEWQEPTEYKEVTFATAARQGEPFKELIDKRGYLPGARLRFCTQHLKILPMKNYMWRGRGYEEWTHHLGLRADEPERVARIHGAQAKQRWEVRCPMADAGHTVKDVTAFWADNRQGFDLGLKHYQGNCDLCFLKATTKRLQILKEDPSVGAWWAAREAEVPGDASSKHFQPGVPVEYLIQLSKRWKPPITFGLEDGTTDCFCTD